MTDANFLAELRIRVYIDQISGYPVGLPARIDFVPILPYQLDSRSTLSSAIYDRAKTLALPCYWIFSDEERKVLLKEE